MTSLIGLLVFAAPQASRPPLIHFCQINLSPSLVMAMGRFPLQCLTGDNAKESEYERHARVTTWAAKMNFPKAASAATLLNASPETRADNVGALWSHIRGASAGWSTALVRRGVGYADGIAGCPPGRRHAHVMRFRRKVYVRVSVLSLPPPTVTMPSTTDSLSTFDRVPSRPSKAKRRQHENSTHHHDDWHRAPVGVTRIECICPGVALWSGQPIEGDRKAQRQQEQSCQPGIENAVRKNALHRDLYVELEPSTEDLASLLGAVTDQTTYAWRRSPAQVVSQVLNCRPMDGTSPLCGMC